jgi:hypothetical protein
LHEERVSAAALKIRIPNPNNCFFINVSAFVLDFCI